MKILVTGGAGFIGSAVCRHIIGQTAHSALNVDSLTYAANLDSLDTVAGDPRYTFERADIGDPAAITRILAEHQPDAVLHLAAESHVDRSIDGPAAFVATNVVGTFNLLQCCLSYWRGLPADRQSAFRFLHVSTDEVFGSLGPRGMFREETAYAPNSPYSASKAASDHLALAWHQTYGLPVLLSNCSNNYGPNQFPEKLIPKTILNALEGRRLPVYGKGENVRDWLYVEDHAEALLLILARGRVGGRYNIGGGAERRNIDVVHAICRLLDSPALDTKHRPHERLIEFVTDRPGHDLRYAVDFSKLSGELGWQPRESFESGLKKTVEWYLRNRPWWERIASGTYRQRLGLG